MPRARCRARRQARAGRDASTPGETSRAAEQVLVGRPGAGERAAKTRERRRDARAPRVEHDEVDRVTRVLSTSESLCRKTWTTVQGRGFG